MNTEELLTLILILSVPLGLLIALIAMRKVNSWSAQKDEELRMALAEIDREFKSNMAKIDTAIAFVKAGYHTPPGEKIIELGDGYITSVNLQGESIVTLAPNHIKH